MTQERHDFTQFKTDLDNMLVWLDEAEALQSTQESMFGDIRQLDAIIRQYKVIQKEGMKLFYLTTYQQILVTVIWHQTYGKGPVR